MRPWTSNAPSPLPPDAGTPLLTTLRGDGRPQQSVVFYLPDGDRFTISLTDGRAKTKNLRRDPRAALFVPSDDVFMWAGFDGRVELSAVARDPHDAVVDRLVDYYRRGNGEHEDWDAVPPGDGGRRAAGGHVRRHVGHRHPARLTRRRRGTGPVPGA